MAYMNQERKQQLAPGIRAVLKKYNVKGSIAVRHHMSLVVTVKQGSIDFIGDYISKATREFAPNEIDHIQVNHYHIDANHSGVARDFLTELNQAMNVGNHNRSDIQSDYFDVGWYTDIHIGQWDKPYALVK